ncbi:hypothetical protein [Clostridium baratii]|uniref:hypothetical protein n=1 Tax=Clostridium baratii TaxID=1561 RepID=UPI0005F2E814|nr:hypothetical protein [Clostridium baratii]KJU72394.1 hypothetical protein UC77_04485 [Clostridium baratii]
MEWDSNNIDNMVIYINEQLKQGKSMASIEKKIFKVNYRVIHKRLDRAGYKKVNNQYVITTSDITKGATKEIERKSENINVENEEATLIEELKELMGPLKQMVNSYQNGSLTNNNAYSEKKRLNKKMNIESKPEVVQRSFKIEKDILREWDEFTRQHKEYKVRDLLGAALTQYMKKFK